MLRRWGGLGILTVALWGLAGCATSTGEIKKPPKPPEEYNLPPENDARFNQPIEYPKEALEKDPLQQKAKGKDTPGMMGSQRSGVGARPGQGF
jgi:hypothetical protein